MEVENCGRTRLLFTKNIINYINKYIQHITFFFNNYKHFSSQCVAFLFSTAISSVFFFILNGLQKCIVLCICIVFVTILFYRLPSPFATANYLVGGSSLSNGWTSYVVPLKYIILQVFYWSVIFRNRWKRHFHSLTTYLQTVC